MMRYFSGLLAALALFATGQLAASPLKNDEELIYFPTSAAWDAQAAGWRVPLHGWVFEAERDSLWRQGGMELLRQRLGLRPDTNHSQHLQTRGWPFLVDNERGKLLSVRIGDSEFQLAPSRPNGHLYGEALLAAPGADATGWLRFETLMPEGDTRRFGGEVQLISESGLSVVSDIDDTIKLTNVLDREEMLANTFLRDFREVSGMAELYRRWERGGAVFHYVTGSPWQLYPALRDFTDSHGFPRGSFTMRELRLKDGALIDFLGSSYDYKLKQIEALLQRYPQRRFILVGDSGERDPEVYGELARRHPRQVTAIYIHNVTGEPGGAERFHRAFAGLPPGRWQLFVLSDEVTRGAAGL